jgi:hypothetical protein
MLRLAIGSLAGRALLVVLSLTAVSVGCGKKKGDAAVAPAHVDGTPHTDAVLDAWSSAGLSPQGFAAVQPAPYAATYCERGSVGGVEALVCEYADDGAIARGQQELKDEWSRVGIQTGVAVRTKRTLLSAVDRERHDPNGKTINQLIQTFRKL